MKFEAMFMMTLLTAVFLIFSSALFTCHALTHSHPNCVKNMQPLNK